MRRAPAPAARREHPQHVARPAAGSCTCRAGARLGLVAARAAASSRRPRPGPPPARPHGRDDPPLGDRATRSRPRAPQVALDAVAAGVPRPRRRCPAAAGSAAPASGTPARAPRSACSWCWSSPVWTPLMPAGARRLGRPVRRRRSRSTPSRPADEDVVHRALARGADPVGHDLGERAEAHVGDPLAHLDVARADGGRGRAATIVPGGATTRRAAWRRRWPGWSGRWPSAARRRPRSPSPPRRR